MLFPLLADFRRKNFPFLNNRNVKIILFIASYLIGVINLVKSTPNPKAYREEKKVTPSQPKQDWLVLARNKLEAVVNQEYQHNQTIAHTRASWKVIDGGG